MTLDEAIKHAEEVMIDNLEAAKGQKADDPFALQCAECADNHRQLAEWLNELKRYRTTEMPKTGKWERWIDMKSMRKYLYKCSVCDATVFAPHPYCSECGSRMEVEE